MGEIKFNKEQEAIINARNTNLLVSAAAGSGKTAVLSERILSLILDKENRVSIDKMLIVTFTKAAAAEMRERIGKNLSKKLEAMGVDDPDYEYLQRQTTLINTAQITTIDSFCLFVIRNNFGDIDLDPNFRIMDEGEKKLMLSDCVENLLEEYYGEMSEDFAHLVAGYFPTKSSGQFEKTILDLFDFVMTNPSPKRWLEVAAKQYDISSIEEAEKTDWWKLLFESIDQDIRRAITYLKKAVTICQEAMGPDKYLATINEDIALIERFYNKRTYKERFEFNEGFSRIPTVKASETVDGDLIDAVKNYRDKAKKIFGDVRDKYKASSDVLINDIRGAKSDVAMLCQLAARLIDDYSAIKKEKNLLDFSDMEHYALQILTKENEDGSRTKTDAAIEYSQYFDIVMVDEYQDSNDVQEEILKSVARDNNYFMVGDVKQSIYKFRQAKPEIFQGKYDRFDYEGINKKIDLNKNYRSRKEVLDFVNTIFQTIMTKASCQIEYDDMAALHYGASYYDEADAKDEAKEKAYYKPEFMLYQEEDSDQPIFQEPFEGEANMVAERIRNIMSSGYRVYDKDAGCIRPVKYRDIVILLRTVSGGIDVTFRRALEAKGIPAYVAQKSGYFDTLEVREILNFLNVIDNPVNDIALYGTMVSYFGGFTKEEAALIKSWEKAGDNADEDVKLKEKLSSFYELINKYRDMATYMPVRELISNMITDTGYLEYVTALSGGNQRRANVLMLLERATDFENTSFHGLFRFIRYIEGLKAKEVDYGEISITDEASDLVRIITDHSSKGLEFPIVFVSCLGKRLNYMDARKQFILDDKLGIGAGMVDTELRCKRTTLIKSAVAIKNKRDTVAEEMRILYVALTRAREKLILTATIDADQTMDKIAGISGFDSLDVLNSVKYTDMILPVLASKDMIPAFTKIYTASDIVKSSIEENVEGITKKELLLSGQLPCDEELLKLLRSRFENKYPYEKLAGLYLKTSVSDIKHEAYEDQHEEKLFDNQEKKPYVVSFDDITEEDAAGKVENRGALRGSAYHRLMELTPFEKMDDLANPDSIRRIIEDTRSKNEAEGKLSKEFNQLINTDKILNFYKTNLAKRMVKSAKTGGLYKEAPFFLGVSANRVEAEFPEDEIMLVQGIIDAYFEEEDYLVLMDYKTDSVVDGGELISRYKVQLDIYAEALERITGKKVKEKIIYSFALGAEIPVI